MRKESIKSDTENGPGQSKRLHIPEAAIPPHVATQMESTQLGRFSAKGGTGFAAEDVNALVDERLGRVVEKTGSDNLKNGADRIADGISIQTKYFDTASRTVGAAFDDTTGLYRYNGMQLEVPKDQYEAAVKLMEKRIEDGKVPGVADPADAGKLIKEGSVTYQQAKNIARAGNIDSLSYDVRNSAVVCGAAFGLGFVMDYGTAIWSGESQTNALKGAALQGLKTSGVAFFTSVGSAQLLRTQTARASTILVRSGLKGVAKTGLGKTAIEKVAHASLGKAVHGASAVNHVSKLLRSNAITGVVTVTVLTLPDIYRATINGSASWAQVGKNLVVNATGVAAGTAGWLGGAALGAAAGSAVPVVGTVVGGVVGGLAGALGAGAAGGMIAAAAMDRLVDDDAIQMQAFLDKELGVIAEEYVMSKEEFKTFLGFIGASIPGGFLGALYASKGRSQFIRDHYEAYAFEIVKNRKPITPPQDQKVLDFIEKLLEDAEANEISEEKEEVYDPSAYVPNFVLDSHPDGDEAVAAKEAASMVYRYA